MLRKLYTESECEYVKKRKPKKIELEQPDTQATRWLSLLTQLALCAVMKLLIKEGY